MFTGIFDDIWIKVLCAALILKVILAIAGILHVVLTLVRADHTDGSCQEGTCAEMISSYIFLIQETEPGRSPGSGGENLSGQNYHRISGCICFSDPGNSDIPGNISGVSTMYWKISLTVEVLVMPNALRKAAVCA